ncbi:MAG: hypothetical protein Hens3KO_26720 [Henriciella sp.]
MKLAFTLAAPLALALVGCSGHSATPAAEVETTTIQPERPASYEAAPETLKVWVDGRAGTGAPVHWVSDGGVYDYPSGEKLFGMIGFDSSTILWPDEPDGQIIHLTRKTFAYTDAETGEVLTEYNGTPVTPIAYPYQMITYRYEDGKIYGDVEQGVGDRIQKIKAEDGIPMRTIGETYVFQAAVFLDFPLPTGAQYQAWENYDFFFHPEGTVSEPHQMAWQRYGARPSFAGDGPAIYHLHSWRVEAHDQFPEQLLEWAKADKPEWLNPPASVEEVRALQSGEAGIGWGD